MVFCFLFNYDSLASDTAFDGKLEKEKRRAKKLLGKQNKNGDAFRDVLQGKLAASG